MNANLERIFQQSYLKPVFRTKIGTHDVYVADGFVPQEQLKNFEKAFQLPLDKPCYATFWIAEVAKGKFFGGVTECDQLHDVETISLNARQSARIKSAVALARRDLTRLKFKNGD